MFRTTRENERKCKKTNNQNPSFSSSLLDQIYRSIDSDVESQKTHEDSRFSGSCPVREQIKSRKKAEEFEDSMFSSSGSSSSDTCSSGFSSSETELMYGNRTAAKPFLVPVPHPRPIRITEKSEKRKQKQSTLFLGNRAHNEREENGLIKSESRAMKIYNNLKKVKQPISPGGRLASFINSLFTATNSVKKSEICRSSGDGFTGKFQTPTKSSSPSQSRSCLSKHSTSTREKQRNTEKRSVRFYPVSVIVGEDSRPCGHKNEEEVTLNCRNRSSKLSVSAVNGWRIGELAAAAAREQEVRAAVAEKSKRVEEMAREILREYEKKTKKKMKELYGRCDDNGQEEEDDDDVLSCSSSELFELDLVGNGRYRDELPVYETTHVQMNQAIASGLIL